MFYCTDILKKNSGKFGAIWLAAFYGKNAKKMLSRRDISRVNIIKACGDVLHPTVQFSLRLQSNLMVGIMRVYKEQVVFFCDDLKSAWRHLQMALTVENMRLIDLQKPELSKHACTLASPARGYRDNDFGVFPKDIFTKSPAELFSGEDAFVSIDGEMSAIFGSPPPTWSPHSPSPPPPPPTRDAHQAEKADITLPDIEILSESPIEIPYESDIAPPLGRDEEMQEPPLAGDAVVPMDDDEDRDHGDDLVRIVDELTGLLVVAPESDHEERKRKSSEDDQMQTPIGATIQVSTPLPPQKRSRRGTPIDDKMKLSDETMRRNMADISNTLRESIIDPPVPMSTSELFKNPACRELREEPFMRYWRNNAYTPRIANEDFTFDTSEFVDDGFAVLGDDTEMASPEVPRVAETPDASAYDPSKLSSIGIVETPQPEGEISAQDVGDMHEPTPDPQRDRESLLGSLIGADLQPIEEQDIEQIDDQFSPIPELPEQKEPDPELEHFEETLLRVLAEEMGDKEETSFQVLFPPRECRKILAAMGLYQMLAGIRARSALRLWQYE